MNPRLTDCIAAIATAPGYGAIAIVRLSGSGSIDVADRVFRGKRRLGAVEGFTVHMGKALGEHGEILDEVLATVFRAPHSYTGEDAVEFSCHGGLMTPQGILQAALSAGARQADPGEFTRRAFLNGRIDLSQAEAVADLIAAGSRRAHRASMVQLEGKLGNAVGALRNELINLCSLLEIDLDFTEEGLQMLPGAEVGGRIDSVDARLSALELSFRAGRVFREGVAVVLTGKPNAGKSSLFNALLKEERAIVTPLPGTTRDVIEEGISVGGVLFRISDTAGLRDLGDAAEVEGIRRARLTARSGDIVILVIDATSGADPAWIASASEEIMYGQKLIVAANKADLLVDHKGRESFGNRIKPDVRWLFTSTVTGEGVHELRELLLASVLKDPGNSDNGLFVTNERHFNSLVRTRAFLQRASKTFRGGLGNEIIAFEIREGLNALSEITGEVTTDEILNNIFGRFCVGK